MLQIDHDDARNLGSGATSKRTWTRWVQEEGFKEPEDWNMSPMKTG